MAKREDVINFGAGPAHLPTEVLEEVRDELLNWQGSGMSVMELSHRSRYFDEIQHDTLQRARQLLHIPDAYDTLLAQGGASTQFAAIPLNLLSSPQAHADYLVTGGWSARAYSEAAALGCQARRVAVGKNEQGDLYTHVPAPSSWDLSPQAEYIYACDNETVFGVELPSDAFVEGVQAQWQARGDAGAPPPLVLDASSNFYSRPLDVSRYGVVYGGAQKNLGTAGVTLCIVDPQFSRAAPRYPHVPTMLQWKTLADNDSRYNTPPTFAIYIMGRCLHWLERAGGVEAIAARNDAKSQMVYEALDRSSLFVNAVEKPYRSRMNIPFRIALPEAQEGTRWDTALEATFLKEADAQGLLMLKGHRSAGGMRASLYNSISLEQASRLVAFLESFEDAHSR